MKTRLTCRLLTAAALATGFSLAARGAGEPSPEKTPDNPPAASAPAKKPMLDKGMAAGEIVDLIGRPDSISPMKTDGVRAEKWTYRKLIRQRLEQVATSVENLPAFIGKQGPGTDDLGVSPELKYSLKHTDTYQVTALLLVNDRLVVARQWLENEISYDR